MRVPSQSWIRIAALAAVSVASVTAFAQAPLRDASHLALPQPTANAAPRSTSGEAVQLFVRLTDRPLAAVAGNKKTGITMTAEQQRAYVAQLAAKQATLMAQISSLGGRQLARLTKAGNALVVEVPANQGAVIARLPGVASVMRMRDYELALTSTVPYIGAAAVQAGGKDGTGVRVAVLDSGIDFMHRNLGGTGSTADFDTCYAQANVPPSGICANYFGPSAPKVVGGFDFVGENWTGTAPNNVLQPDPNPIARKVTGGHGTNVADIIAGRSADGLHKGVAPGAKVLAGKVCSAITSSCSGLGILQGLEWALDPNFDNDLSDAVDVINMSLGASYGQRENPSVLFANTASQFGVVVVVSAGNSANRPFITGSPSMATSAISVAQTQIPSATVLPINISAPASIAGPISNTASLPWAPGSFGPANVKATAASPAVPPANDACAALPAGSLAGMVAIVRRGSCSISAKVQFAAAAGAVGMILDNNALGDPPSFSQDNAFPGPYVPTYVVSITDGNRIRARLAAGDTVTAATGAPLSAAGSMVTTSSRGPSMGMGQIKPDIGAPGASTSAEVGTGTGQSVFGGTSGAAPMVAGSAALLLQQYPNDLPHMIKARLMNSAETQITTYAGTPSAANPLAPVTRIGGGEVRVNRAISLNTLAWDASDPAAVSLSMGVTRNSGLQTYRKRVLVRNLSNMARTYAVSTNFRDTIADQASGGVMLSVPASVNVPANGSATFFLTAVVDASKLPFWSATGINGGTNGGNGPLLDLPEYDGYVTIAEGGDTVRLPWHILPHRAHNIAAPAAVAMGGNASAPLNLTNVGGSVNGAAEVFYLTGVSPQLPAASLPMEGESFTVHDLRAVGVRAVGIGGGQFGVQFAINTWAWRSHPAYPAEVSVFIDQDGDGTDDFEAWTQESGAFASSGQTLVFVRKISSGTGSAFFFATADLASGNVIMTIPMVTTTLAGASGPQLGLTLNSTFRFRVALSDNYFTGATTDVIGPMQINLNNPRFFPTGFAHAVSNAGTSVTVNRNAPGDALSTSQTGLLLMYSDGRYGREADAVTITP